jgi:hypothetical protein
LQESRPSEIINAYSFFILTAKVSISMKRLSTAFILLTLPSLSFSSDLDQWKKDTESIWRTGAGAEDGTFTAISTSMLGWGLGLSAGIAILASVLHQSTAGHSHIGCDDD